jgi:2-polyprenyl-3-methyl-5-hydroxy-6-metoxy-1,4-benzoquinol methylase
VVTGIDTLPSASHADRMEEYLECDLSQGLDPVLPRLEGRLFDKILLLDVLEHLPRPELILAACRKLLAPDGHILVSVPNVANITVRLMLLAGRFEYTERGILDRTHLRFYTRRTARRLVEQAGYAVAREKATVMPIELALGLSAGNPLMRAANFLLAVATRLFPNLLGYQCLYWLRPKACS